VIARVLSNESIADSP